MDSGKKPRDSYRFTIWNWKELEALSLRISLPKKQVKDVFTPPKSKIDTKNCYFGWLPRKRMAAEDGCSLTFAAEDGCSLTFAAEDGCSLKAAEDGSLKAAEDGCSLKAAEDGCSLKAAEDGCSLKTAEDGCSLLDNTSKLVGPKAALLGRKQEN